MQSGNRIDKVLSPCPAACGDPRFFGHSVHERCVPAVEAFLDGRFFSTFLVPNVEGVPQVSFGRSCLVRTSDRERGSESRGRVRDRFPQSCFGIELRRLSADGGQQ